MIAAKILGARVEGLGFAVPVADALAALGLRVGDESDAALLSETGTLDLAPKVALYKDRDDDVPSIAPEGEGSRASEDGPPREPLPSARDGRTPGFVPAMRWGGLSVGLIGAGVGLVSYLAYNQQTTKSQFHALETANTVGWIAGVAGAGLFAISFTFGPSRGPRPVVSSLHVGPGGVQWEGAF